MIEAGSIGIKAVWSDAEARQSADRFYADMKRKRDEAMTGAAGQGPGASGLASPGAWRMGGMGGGNNIWINPGGWRGADPAAGAGMGRFGGFGGGGFGGGGAASPAGGAGGFPSWLMGWQSPINQQQQIPPWLMGWSSPINPAAGQGAPPAPRNPAGRSFFNIRPMAAAYLAIRGAGDVLRQKYREEDQAYIYRTHGSEAALEDDAAQNQAEMGDPIGRSIRGFFASQNMTRRFFTSDEDKREAIDRARSSVKDAQARTERFRAQREADTESVRFGQQADLARIRDSTERRLAQSQNAYDNVRINLDNRLATMRDELAANTDPAARPRLQAGIKATESNNLKVLTAAARARAAEDAEIRRDAVVNSRALQSDVTAAQLEYQDRPRSAAAQRIFGRTREAFEKQTDKEGAQDILRIGRFELMNMQKDASRRGFGEQFDPTTSAFGVRQTGKEDTAELSEKIGQLIQTINQWMPGLK